MLIVLRFSLHFVPANSIVTYSVQAHCRKSRRLSISVAWVATVQVKSSWKRSRGRCWAFWFQTKCSAWCQVCYVTEALTDVHFSCKEAAILLYQMSYGAATPRHLVYSINKISTRTAWICFFCDLSYLTCWNCSPRSPNRSGAMADSKQVAAKHQQSLQFVSHVVFAFGRNRRNVLEACFFCDACDYLHLLLCPSCICSYFWD